MMGPGADKRAWCMRDLGLVPPHCRDRMAIRRPGSVRQVREGKEIDMTTRLRMMIELASLIYRPTLNENDR